MLADANRRKQSVSFVLLDNSLWKLASFVNALGITKDQARSFDPNRLEHHQRMIGRGCMVEVTKEDKYCNVTRWWKRDDAQTEKASNPAPPATPKAEPTEENFGDIPF
jgi:hypothetical protein